MAVRTLPTLTVATLVHNEFEGMFATVSSLLTMAAGHHRFIMLDNASDPPVERFLCDVLRPAWGKHCIGRPKYIRNDENNHMMGGCQQIVEACTSDVVAIFHNDVEILQQGWDTEVLRLFVADPKLGMVSFFGCPGIRADGGRGGIVKDMGLGWSNMIDAEHHGVRITEPRPIAVPDGFALILRRQMLETTGGYHPLNYNYDICLALQSLAAGFRNMVAPISCRHLGSQSRLQPDYMDWMYRTFGTRDEWAFFSMMGAAIVRDWGLCLPLHVNEDFTFAEVDPLTGGSTGQSIYGYDWRTQGGRVPGNAAV